MTDFTHDIDAALNSTETIPRDSVLLWINAATDLLTLSKLYRITGEGYYRIQPELGKEAECSAIQRYLLECIRQNVTGNEEVEDRWSAAGTLHAWFYHLSEMDDAADVLKTASQAITELYLKSNEDVRGAIEKGFLEHALEMSALRPYFEHWSLNDCLKPAWERALEWGKAHPNFMWGQLQQLRKIQEGKE